jgi:CHAT domain-containing protein
LIFTPPTAASVHDDGYLTVSEIAGLSFDADWVILSACNTGTTSSNETAVSGFESAFFYAGARSLLVSQWSVNSESTTDLITDTLTSVGADSGVGPAEALRRAMEKMAHGNVSWKAHPAYWAPFMVVGEGAVPMQ